MLFRKKKLKRKKINKKFGGYHIKHKINDKKVATNYLDKLIKYLNKYSYESNEDFVMMGRKKFIYDEVMNILNGNIKVEEPIYFALGSLDEFMCSNNTLHFGETNDEEFAKLRDKNDNYIKNEYICLEEKEYIMSMINAIKGTN